MLWQNFQSLSSPQTMNNGPCCRCLLTAPVWRERFTPRDFPGSGLGSCASRVRAANPDVTLVDIPTDNPQLALRAIELLHQEMPDAAIFAIGNLTQPQIIVNAMRAGAREFIERPTTTTDLLEAFVRLTAAQRRGTSGRDSRKSFFRHQCERRKRRNHRRCESRAGAAIWPTGKPLWSILLRWATPRCT